MEFGIWALIYMPAEKQTKKYSLDSVLESIGQIDDTHRTSICRKLNITPTDEVTINRTLENKLLLETVGFSKSDDVPDDVKNKQKYEMVVFFLEQLKRAQSADKNNERITCLAVAAGFLKKLGLNFHDVFPSADPNLEEQIGFLKIQMRLNGVIDYTTPLENAGLYKRHVGRSPPSQMFLSEDPVGKPTNDLNYCKTDWREFIEGHPELHELYLKVAKSYLVRKLGRILAKHAIYDQKTDNLSPVSIVPFTLHDQTGMYSDVSQLILSCDHFGIDLSGVFDGLGPENYFRVQQRHGVFLPIDEATMRGYFDILRKPEWDIVTKKSKLEAYLKEKNLFHRSLDLVPAKPLDWNQIVKVEDWQQGADGSWH